MSDREMLEMAAKAAGLNIGFSEGEPHPGRPYCWCDGGRVSAWWNPLEDDGDALQLVVKLGLCVAVFPRSDPPDVIVGYRVGDNGSNVIECLGDDHYSAVRRAIVCAAAEIGRKINE